MASDIMSYRIHTVITSQFCCYLKLGRVREMGGIKRLNLYHVSTIKIHCKAISLIFHKVSF